MRRRSFRWSGSLSWSSVCLALCAVLLLYLGWLPLSHYSPSRILPEYPAHDLPAAALHTAGGDYDAPDPFDDALEVQKEYVDTAFSGSPERKVIYQYTFAMP